MNNEQKFSSVLTLAVADHEVMASAIENSRNILAGGSLTDIVCEAGTLKELTRTKLAPHFKMEEEHIFPALLQQQTDTQTTRLVADLIEDHRRILEKAKLLDKIPMLAVAGGSSLDTVKMIVRDLIDTLQNHATREDGLLLALLEKQRQSLIAPS